MGQMKIRGSTIYGISLLVALLGFIIPVPIQWIAPIIGYMYYRKLKKQGRIIGETRIEVLLIALYTIIGVGGFVFATGYALGYVPWWKIILVGMAADVIGNTLGAIPIFGDILAATINAIMAITIIGGFAGPFIAVALGIITLLPGPSLFGNTLFIVIFKLLSKLVGL